MTQIWWIMFTFFFINKRLFSFQFLLHMSFHLLHKSVTWFFLVMQGKHGCDKNVIRVFFPIGRNWWKVREWKRLKVSLAVTWVCQLLVSNEPFRPPFALIHLYSCILAFTFFTYKVFFCHHNKIDYEFCKQAYSQRGYKCPSWEEE